MTRTIVNKIIERARLDHNKLVTLAETYERVMPVLNEDIEDMGAALRGLDELKIVLDDIHKEMSAGVGNLAEGSDLLQELVNGSANTTLLMSNIVEVFFKSDYKILVQVLMELDPPMRRQAFDDLPIELRQELLRELMFLSESGDAA